MIPASVTTLLFDLGGVIVNIDYNKTVSAFRQLGYTDFHHQFTLTTQSQIFQDFEVGKLSEAEFRLALRMELNLSCTDSEMDDAWNAMILDTPAERLHLLKKLSSDYRLLLLSNTNSIHIKYFNNTLQQHHQIPDLQKFFKKLYYSFEIGLRKPDKKVFQYILENENLKPDEVMFFEDGPGNIESALKVGLKTCLISPARTLTDILFTAI